LAVGYGALGNYSQYTTGQQKLMAMRAAQVDAYRNLAEQVYGFRVWGNTAVSAFATQNDNVRSYVDSFIRGARVVNTSSIADGNFETTVELEVSQAFLDNLNRQGNSRVRSNTPVVCTVPGCFGSSANYISH
jgi:outer membrane protein FlgP